VVRRGRPQSAGVWQLVGGWSLIAVTTAALSACAATHATVTRPAAPPPRLDTGATAPLRHAAAAHPSNRAVPPPSPSHAAPATPSPARTSVRVEADTTQKRRFREFADHVCIVIRAEQPALPTTDGAVPPVTAERLAVSLRRLPTPKTLRRVVALLASIYERIAALSMAPGRDGASVAADKTAQATALAAGIPDCAPRPLARRGPATITLRRSK
jgi:hypothetical protein